MNPLIALCAAFALFATGCQSNAQQDLVIRELRTQEDQLYAMEDYLAQYQQLICKYRAENAALRRQLAEGSGGTVSELPEPQAPPRRGGGSPPATSPTPANGSPTTPVDPDVPPLDLSSQFDERSGNEAMPGVMLASATMPAGVPNETAPPQQIELRGQIVNNEADGTRQLLVDVTGLDVAGEPLAIAGKLSLLLSPPGTEGTQILARWDVSPAEVQSALAEPNGPTTQLSLDLPPEVAIGSPVELWARLLPRGGNKLLTHITIDPQQAATIAAVEDTPPTPPGLPQEPRTLPEYFEDSAVTQAEYTETQPATESTLPPASYELVDAGWSTAKPGDPAGPANPGQADSKWRASHEAPPVAVPYGNLSRSRRPRGDRPTKVATKSENTLSKPIGWSPDRPTAAAEKSPRTAAAPRRPSWSSNR